MALGIALGAAVWLEPFLDTASDFCPGSLSAGARRCVPEDLGTASAGCKTEGLCTAVRVIGGNAGFPFQGKGSCLQIGDRESIADRDRGLDFDAGEGNLAGQLWESGEPHFSARNTGS